MRADNDRRKATTFIAFGLFILWGFGLNTVGRRLLTSIDGVIVARRAVPGATEYTVRGNDGREQVFSVLGRGNRYGVALTTLLFLSTKSRVELAGGGSKIPDECEAAFWNHGAYACWYTIQDHPFWFALSLGALATGAGIIAWSQRHWFAKPNTDL